MATRLLPSSLRFLRACLARHRRDRPCLRPGAYSQADSSARCRARPGCPLDRDQDVVGLPKQRPERRACAAASKVSAPIMSAIGNAGRRARRATATSAPVPFGRSTSIKQRESSSGATARAAATEGISMQQKPLARSARVMDRQSTLTSSTRSTCSSRSSLGDLRRWVVIEKPRIKGPWTGGRTSSPASGDASDGCLSVQHDP